MAGVSLLILILLSCYALGMLQDVGGRLSPHRQANGKAAWFIAYCAGGEAGQVHEIKGPAGAGQEVVGTAGFEPATP